MIDLHLHTTASDGTDTPPELVRACRGAGITTMAVTDHDTTAALAEAARDAERAGIDFVPAIEITAAREGRDVHILGYFIDPESPALKAFLAAQLEDRIRRARAVGERLAALGVGIDMETLIQANGGRPVLRPHVAQALVDAGHVEKEDEAFDRYIGEGRPAYVARRGATPAGVVAVIREAGGLSSMAHPGVTGQDALIPGLAAAGLDALEAYHTDHAADDTARYLALAGQFGLAVTGGSDFHGVRSGHSNGFGTVHLPASHYAAFRELVRRRTRG
jgi:predicted metal-dependent phosphoesterase TrpH